MAEDDTENADLTDFSPPPIEPDGPGTEEDGDIDPATNDMNGLSGKKRSASDLEAVFDVPVTVQAVLGRTYMDVSELLQLANGDVIPLDRKVGEAIDVYINNSLVARGEIVLVDDRLGITMTEIIKKEQHG